MEKHRTSHNNLFSALYFLPTSISDSIKKLDENFLSTVQEIRLRKSAPLTFSCFDGDFYLSLSGEIAPVFKCRDISKMVFALDREIDETFLKICQNSIHTHQNELIQGFVTTRNGCRVGIAGTAVINSGEVTSVRDISSLCIRISRNHKNCSKSLLSSIVYENRVLSTLICGEPSSGKSSLIKDLAFQLSAGLLSGIDRNFRVSLVDERGELSYGQTFLNCDVLKYYPKAKGIEQAVRCLAPEVVIFDEMGVASEVDSVLESLNCGVSVITTAHCFDRKSLLNRPQLKTALYSGAFEQVVFLKGRKNPGVTREVIKVCDLLD